MRTISKSFDFNVAGYHIVYDVLEQSSSSKEDIIVTVRSINGVPYNYECGDSKVKNSLVASASICAKKSKEISFIEKKSPYLIIFQPNELGWLFGIRAQKIRELSQYSWDEYHVYSSQRM